MPQGEERREPGVREDDAEGSGKREPRADEQKSGRRRRASRASGPMTAKLSRPKDGDVDPAVAW